LKTTQPAFAACVRDFSKNFEGFVFDIECCLLTVWPEAENMRRFFQPI
jgi:hypothetical protein